MIVNETRGILPPAQDALLLSVSGRGSSMPSRRDMAGHTKAFDYPVMDHCLDLRQGGYIHIRDEILPRAEFEPTALKDLLIISGSPYKKINDRMLKAKKQ